MGEDTMAASLRAVFAGQSYAFSTPLPPDECWRRVRDEVTEPRALGAKMRGWMAMRQDPTILRKLQPDQHFLLATGLYDRQSDWSFHAHLQAQDDHTLITGQQRAGRWWWIVPLMGFVYGLYLVGGTLLDQPVFLISRESGWVRLPLPVALLLALMPLVIFGSLEAVLRIRRRREVAAITTFIQTHLQATDISAGAPRRMD